MYQLHAYHLLSNHFRAQIRSKKLNTDKPAEKAKFELELAELDKQMEETQAKLTKKTILEQEVRIEFRDIKIHSQYMKRTVILW